MIKRLRNIGSVVFLVLFTLNCGTKENSQKASNSSGFDPSKSDAKAIEVVDEMLVALGGRENWEKALYLSFRWLVEKEGKVVADYRHDWDRYSNRYRVEGSNREGKHYVVLFNTQSKEGQVYVEGVELPADSANSWIEKAYGRFINDCYWLFMPYKLKDPGVILNHEGEREIEEIKYDVVKVTFENVGLTPNDTYWAFINKSTRLMDKWEYVLQDREPPPTSAWWKDWQTLGGIKLAMDRKFEERPLRIYFKDVKVSSMVDEGVFKLTSKTF